MGSAADSSNADSPARSAFRDSPRRHVTSRAGSLFSSQGGGRETPTAGARDSSLRPEVPGDLGHAPPPGCLSAKGYFLTYSQIGDTLDENIHSLINVMIWTLQ